MKRWYVIQIYAGYEDLVKADLERRIAEKGMQDLFGQVLIPSAKVKNYLSASEEDQQLFPGYMLIEVELNPETMRLVTSSPRVLRFLGGQQPMPLSEQEIKRIVSQVKGEVALATKKTEFVVGREVQVTEGPFAGFVGIIDRIDLSSEKLSVLVSILGRLTPVELRFDQVKQ